MEGLFSCPQRNLKLSSGMLRGGVALLIVGIVGAYGVDQHLSLPAVLAAHALTVLGPTSLKLGYVLRLIAQHQMRQPGWEECCAAG